MPFIVYLDLHFSIPTSINPLPNHVSIELVLCMEPAPRLPTLQRKIRVLADWTLDMFFKRDVAMLKTLMEEEEKAKEEEKNT